MTDNDSTTKVDKKNQNKSVEEEMDELLSLDNLDAVLAEEDPEFAKSLKEINFDSSVKVEIYKESLVHEYTLEDEIKLWTGRRERLAKFFPFLPKISYKLKIKRTILRLSWMKFKKQTRHNIHNAGPLTLNFLKKTIRKIRSSISDGLAGFSKLSGTKKLAFLGLLLTTAASGVVINNLAKHKLLPADNELFMLSLEEWAQAKYQHTATDQMESFYDSARTSQSIIEMKKIIVNLRRSATSGPNPMGAFEFYIEGTVPESAVEVKDREPEMKDLFLRTIEEMNYDQLASGEGKHLLCERLRKELNRVLTKGKVRRIFIKTAIVKP